MVFSPFVPRFRSTVFSAMRWLAVIFWSCSAATLSFASEATGTLTSQDGVPVAGASVRLLSAQGFLLSESRSGADGSFRVPMPPTRTDVRLEIRAGGFAPLDQVLTRFTKASPLRLTLWVAPLPQAVTVTAERGRVLDVGESAALVSVAELRSGTTGPLPTLGNALEGQLGVLVQQSSYGQV
jgi:hypothetical protein